MASPDHQRVREIFLQAVELPPEEQDAFLQEQCGDDSALLATVQRLFVHHRPDDLLLEVEDPTALPSAANVDTGPVPPDAPPQAASPLGTLQFGDTKAIESGLSAVGMMERHSQVFRRTHKDRIWITVVSVAVLLGLVSVGYWVHVSIHKAIGASLRHSMQAMQDGQVYAIETWLAAEIRLVESWAQSPDVESAVAELQAIADSADDLNQSLASSEAGTRLASAMSNAIRSAPDDSYQFAVWNRENTLIADSSPEHAEFLGNGTTEYGAGLLSRVFRGETVLWLPTKEGYMTEGFTLKGPVTKPGIALIAPVRSEEERPIAAILISSPALQERFEQLLQQARFGESTEAYALTEDGYLLTETRRTDYLKKIGRLEDSEHAIGNQALRVTDPGTNLLEDFQGEVSVQGKEHWPLTRAAQSLSSRLDGIDVSGYRDYRGVEVVGVWTWIPDYRFGVIMEIDYREAYSPLVPLRTAFVVILAALAVAALTAIITFFALMRRRRREPDGSIVGPYTLRSLLGEGGFAHVYLASHALLKRPTAVKILKPEQMNDKNLVRFEREVQLASSLTHPNTIGIYDYGSTAEGRFYYAMEFIKGLSLKELIDLDGPQSPARTVWIVDQICRSLREAHGKGLIHRDIKPQNIMLCRRGGEYDTVKVLDFGLARNLGTTGSNRVTETQLLIGTPLYIAPERIVDPACMDPRSDIYSLGILAYFLLTGREPFDAADSIDALAQTINRTARRPSEQSPGPIPEVLDRLIRDCHSRAITDRPESMDVVLSRLHDVHLVEPWDAEQAASWWSRHRAEVTTTMEKMANVKDEQTTATLVPPDIQDIATKPT